MLGYTDIREVAVSGSVGKQTIAVPVAGGANSTAEINGFVASPSGANMTVKIRHGNASGEVIHFGRYLSAYGAQQVKFQKPFKVTRGLHVKVIGANALVYLELN